MLSKEEIEFNLKALSGVMLNFEDRICDEMQERVKEVREYIEQLEKTISRKMSNNKRLSIKYLKQRHENEELKQNKQKLIDKLEKVKQKDEQWNALNGELAVWTFAQEILEIVKGEKED